MMKIAVMAGLVLALASITVHAEVDQNGCRNTKKMGYVCKAQTDKTWERKKRQAERAQERQDYKDKYVKPRHAKKTLYYIK